MCSAAETDPDVAAALAEAERRRYRDATNIVRLIAGDELAPDIDARTAADLWFALTSYDVYRLLIDERRWPAARYESWITRALQPLLPRP